MGSAATPWHIRLSWFLLFSAAVVCLGALAAAPPQPSSAPKELSLAQKKVVVSHLLAKYGDRLSPAATSQLLAAVQLARPAATDPDLVKNRLVHSWATNNVTCKRVKTCMSLAPEVCAEVCQDGSIQPDPWTSYALQTQREIQYDTPLNYVSLPGTHNSAITLADGYGLSEGMANALTHLISEDWQVYIANQQLGLWDQFKLGVRHFELDVHWWSDAIRICHAGGIHLQSLNDFIKFLGTEFGIHIDWDSETIGCFSPYDRTLNDTFVEIRQFVFAPGNEREFVIFYFDDEEDLLSWSKVNLILQGIEYHFGSYVFTPVDKQRLFPRSWPSFRQLNAAGKRLMFVSRTDYGEVMNRHLFARANMWTEYGPFPFSAYPNCTVRHDPVNNGKIARVFGDSLAYGPFWNGYDGQMMMPADLLEEAQCNVNFACVDQLSPILAEGFVWSWDKDQPKLRGGCAAMQPNGRWAALDCNATTLRSACRNPTTGAFVLSANATSWRSAQASCPTGFDFAVPLNGYANSQLAAVLRASSTPSSSVWLNRVA